MLSDSIFCQADNSMVARNKKLTLTLICQSPERAAPKIWALAHHPDVEKLYVVPLYEQAGTDKNGVSCRIQQNIEHLTSLPRSERNPTYKLTQPPSFSGYDFKARLAAYETQTPKHSKAASACRLPRDQIAQQVRDVITFGVKGDASLAAIQKADTLRALVSACEQLTKTPASKQEPPAPPRFGHQHIAFEEIAKSDMICCDTLSGFDWLADEFPNTPFLNNPKHVADLGSKTHLPQLAQDTDSTAPEGAQAYAPCQKLTSVSQLQKFADAHGEPFVLKEADSLQGQGIYKAMRNQHGNWRIYRDGKEIEDVPEWFYAHSPMLAMKWLEPKMGDVRVLCLGGQVIGAYNRIPKEGSELCNRAQGGSPEDYTLSHREEAMIKRAARELEKHGQRWIGFDLMADASGRRYITEVNLNNSGGLDTIHDYSLSHPGSRPAAEHYANAIVAVARGETRQMGR